MASSSPSAFQPLFTSLTREEKLRLWPLAVHAGHLLQQLHYVDYRQAEADAALLAHKLRQRYATEELQRMSFNGLPRGGLIVLGLLAYQLELQPEQLRPADKSGSNIICMVDDCALSGLRLQQALSAFEGHRAVVALLYAAPGLRSAVQKRYPFVEVCLSAHDLAEKPPDSSFADDGRLDSLLDGRLYSGPLETVAFAWNEPDLLVLTPTDDEPTHQWRFIPPHKCLKNRTALGLPPLAVAAEKWVVPLGIVYGWFDGVLYLLNTNDQEVFRLDGFAADCWRSVAGFGTAEDAAAFLQNRYEDLNIDQIRNALESNLLRLESKGLLTSLL